MRFSIKVSNVILGLISNRRTDIVMKKPANKIKKIVKIAIICFLVLFVFFKIEEIADGITFIKTKIFSSTEKTEEPVMTDVDFSAYNPLVDENNAWYCNPIIAHGGGGIYGQIYTNSLEAMQLSVENGVNIIEVDMVISADKQLILKHDWDEDEEGNDIILSHEEFMGNAISYLYTPMDINALFEFMKLHENVYIVVDVKGGQEAYELLVNAAISSDNEKLLDRFIIQLYARDGYWAMKEIYPFENFLYTLYVSNDKDWNGIAAFCLDNDIHVVTMPVGWAVSAGEELNVFQEQNIHVYVHTVNDMQTVIDMKAKGISGFYSDWLKPEDFKKAGVSFN